MESHLHVQVTPRAGDRPASVRIGDVEFPVIGFTVDPDETGTPMLSLALSPDSIQIGTLPAPDPAPAADSTPKVSSWGDGSHPDPRERIPGWVPELGEQVAGHAERIALRQILSPLTYLRRFGGEGGSVAVPA